MSTSSNRKATKFKPTKNLKKSQMSSPWKNQRNAGAKVLIIQGKYITYLAANNELLSKRVKELNGQLNDLQASIEHSDEVNLEIFKVTDRDVCYINVIEVEKLEDSSWRNNLRGC